MDSQAQLSFPTIQDWKLRRVVMDNVADEGGGEGGLSRPGQANDRNALLDSLFVRSWHKSILRDNGTSEQGR